MDKKAIIESAIAFTQVCSQNYISEDVAICPEYVGMKLFEAPIFAFGAADDEIYTSYKSAGVIGGHFLTPAEWLPGARTVISFFLPFTERIKSANSQGIEWPAKEWLHGRIEGQKLVVALSAHLNSLLLDAGYESLVPPIDTRFKVGSGTSKFTSNWSERHAAFACGLGTFGLSRGLITNKGMCGRFGSVLTSLDLPADGRQYSDTYEYCIMCGLCAIQCPVNDISLEEGKKFTACSTFLDEVARIEKPRYGCGKCQVTVPCESERP